MTKISDLSALTGAGVDDAADLLPIVDMSEAGAARNKKITIDETRIALGLSSADSPQFTALNLGHASDTTITRVSAGVVAIEGVNIVTTAGGVTFAADIVVPDEAYDATAWNGSLEVPTKNAVRDKIETISAGTGVTVEDEGSSEGTGITTLNFTGAGVSVTVVGAEAEIIVPGGGGGIDVEDEGAAEATGATILNFTGAGVTAADVGGGQVDITIPGGGGSGTAYEAGPITEPTTGTLSAWVNQGTSTVSDGTDAMILKPQVDGKAHAREMNAPGTPYDIYMRVDIDCLSSGANTDALNYASGIFFRDSSDGECLCFGMQMERISGDENNTPVLFIERWTAANGTATYPLTRYNIRPWMWLRVHNDGTTFTFYAGQDGKNWHQVGTETLAAHIDTADKYGVYARGNSFSSEVVANISYFSTTAPS